VAPARVGPRRQKANNDGLQGEDGPGGPEKRASALIFTMNPIFTRTATTAACGTSQPTDADKQGPTRETLTAT